MINIDGLIVYRNFEDSEILKMFVDVYNKTEYISAPVKGSEFAMVHSMIGKLIDLAAKYGFSGNLWHNYLTLLLVNNENAFSKACELRSVGDCSLKRLAIHDFMIFRELFRCDLEAITEYIDTSVISIITNYKRLDDSGSAFNKRIRNCICELSERLAESRSIDEFADSVMDFYRRFGVGKLGLHKAFRIDRDENGACIVPITNIAHVRLDDIVGYENAKKQLTDNTEAFLKGKRCNNCLIFGDAGTGKSSSIKAILNKYYEDGLRIIEVYRHQIKDINEIITIIKNRQYKFILYMDDLSFEDFETEYKYLKAVIEGGLEKKPPNVLIYATSNRRHLIKESFSDRIDQNGDVHKTDTLQEKLSLSARFGISIYFGSPDKKQFENIVLTLAKRDGVKMTEQELLREANRWELSHGGFSGRTARQFVDYLLGKQ